MVFTILAYASLVIAPLISGILLIILMIPKWSKMCLALSEYFVTIIARYILPVLPRFAPRICQFQLRSKIHRRALNPIILVTERGKKNEQYPGPTACCNGLACYIVPGDSRRDQLLEKQRNPDA